MQSRRNVVYYGPETIVAAGLVTANSAAIVEGASEIRALVVDARTADSFFHGAALLRALYDDPHRPTCGLDPRRVLALIATGDVEAAFAFGRYGIDAVIEERALGDLEQRLARILLSAEGEGRP